MHWHWQHAQTGQLESQGALSEADEKALGAGVGLDVPLVVASSRLAQAGEDLVLDVRPVPDSEVR
jgi:hypothetical protein